MSARRPPALEGAVDKHLSRRRAVTLLIVAAVFAAVVVCAQLGIVTPGP